MLNIDSHLIIPKYDFNFSGLNQDQLKDDPQINVVYNFLSKDVCDKIISLAEPKLKDAVYKAPDEEEWTTYSKGRHCKLCWFKNDETDYFIELTNRFSALIGLPSANFEHYQVLKYVKGDKFIPHQDAELLTNIKNNKFVKMGQRITTAILYLNCGFTGGDTTFYHGYQGKQYLSIQPVCGNLLLFNNCHEHTLTPHNDSVHSGTEVVDGVKYALVLWVRNTEVNYGT